MNSIQDGAHTWSPGTGRQCQYWSIQR